ncbi:MAG: hypothetical protein WBV31_07450 [Terriglobales bacterium]|jgi:chaperonin GroEL
MAATPATVDNRILARAETPYAMFDGIVSHTASDKAQPSCIHFDCGYLSPYFITDPERMEVAFQDAYVLIHEGKIRSRNDLLPLLERLTQIGSPLLIIAEDVGDEALATLVVSKLRGPLQVAAVRAPGFGEQQQLILRRMARVTGASPIAKGNEIQLRNANISNLGQARKITVGKNQTVVEAGTSHRHLFLRAQSCKQANA